MSDHQTAIGITHEVSHNGKTFKMRRASGWLRGQYEKWLKEQDVAEYTQMWQDGLITRESYQALLAQVVNDSRAGKYLFTNQLADESLRTPAGNLAWNRLVLGLSCRPDPSDSPAGPVSDQEVREVLGLHADEISAFELAQETDLAAIKRDLGWQDGKARGGLSPKKVLEFNKRLELVGMA